MRHASFVPLACLLALAGCNANRVEPEVALPPVPTSIRVTPPGDPLPQEQGCAASIAGYRASREDELAAGRLTKEAFDAIQNEIAEAGRACARGDDLSAAGLLRASKAQHGP